MFFTFTITQTNDEGSNSQHPTKSFLNFVNYANKLRIKANDGEIITFPWVLNRTEQHSFTISCTIPGTFNIDDQFLFEYMDDALRDLKIRKDYYVSKSSKMLGTPEAKQNRTTLNQHMIELNEFDRQAIPDRFLCSLSGQVMDDPVQIAGRQPGETAYADRDTLLRSRSNLLANLSRLFISSSPESLEVDENLKNEIHYFMSVDVASKHLIEKINSHLNIDEKIHQAYMQHEGNPYGSPQQRFGIARSLFTSGRTVTITDKNNRLLESYREKLEYTPLNYPHPSQTATALKHVYHAFRSRNHDEFERIMNAYPNKARDYFLEFAKIFDRNSKYDTSEDKTMRPHEEKERFQLEPHRMKITRE